MKFNNMERHLIIFGTKNYKNSINSLVKSAKNYFEHFHIFSPDNIDSDFFEKNKSILTQSRGAGYWLWKPYFIQKVLESVNDGDIVFYVDAGNILLYDPSFLYQYFKLNNGIILFDNRDGMTNGESAKNYISCKKDSFVLMNCDTEKYVFGTHLNASYQIYQKNQNSLEFVDEYLTFCMNEQIITDSPNVFGDNYPGYYDHRHDQSVLSILTIKRNVIPLIDPSEWGNKCGVRMFNQLFHHHRNSNYTI